MKINSPYTFRIEIAVRWKELDALNHVNNAQFFSYFEEARIKFLSHINQETISSKNSQGPILAHVACNFKSQIHYPDTLSIGSGVSRMGRSSFDIDHDIYSHEQDKIVATAHSVVVMLDYQSGKATPISDEMKNKIEVISTH